MPAIYLNLNSLTEIKRVKFANNVRQTFVLELLFVLFNHNQTRESKQLINGAKTIQTSQKLIKRERMQEINPSFSCADCIKIIK